MGTILALICIIIGFIVAIFDVKILFEPLVWFVAAISFEWLGLPAVGLFTTRRGPE